MSRGCQIDQPSGKTASLGTTATPSRIMAQGVSSVASTPLRLTTWALLLNRVSVQSPFIRQLLDRRHAAITLVMLT